MKAFPWKCGTCGKREVRPETVASYSTEVSHDGRAYQLEIEGFDLLRCGHCNAVMLDDNSERRISDALRAKANLLRPSQIRSGRESLELTQKEMSSILDISESTLSRWETGSQIQQRGMDRYLRGFFAFSAYRHMLSRIAAWNDIKEMPFYVELAPVAQVVVPIPTISNVWGNCRIGGPPLLDRKSYLSNLGNLNTSPDDLSASERTPSLRKIA